MYLWCSICLKVNTDEAWYVGKFKYGVCPMCGCSAYRNAINWETLCKANGYSTIPGQGESYSLYPTLEL